MFQSIAVWMLIATMLIQPLSVSGLTLNTVSKVLTGTANKDIILSGPSSGIAMLQGDEALQQLKKDTIKSLNQDLLYQVSDFELSGPVGVILTFSENALISAYTNTNQKQTYQE